MQRPPNQSENNDEIHEHDLIDNVHGPSQSDIERSWEGYDDYSAGQKSGGMIWKVTIGIVSLVILASMTIGIIGPLVGGSITSDSSIPRRVNADVVRVIDGSTIVVDYGDGERVVRMIGVVTPPYGNPLHQLVPQVTENWLSGMEVTLESDQTDSDIQGRLLRYVYLDNIMINAALILNGLGTASTESSNHRHQGYLAEMERQARDAGAGIWDEAFHSDPDEEPQTRFLKLFQLKIVSS
ncbi:MAG: hypothetical protein FI699_02100 [SAR202 cluster bacterium]|nr:hypothetical protein [SAR202 cluster bacterium]|tara:strand:- start:289 stop:1005 length:717 start_codon:yes stop_codon:yes gene_type:complete